MPTLKYRDPVSGQFVPLLGSGMSLEEADARYAPKEDQGKTLLEEANWWVDAGKFDYQLIDLSGGNGKVQRSTGAACPDILANIGQDYIWSSPGANQITIDGRVANGSRSTVKFIPTGLSTDCILWSANIPGACNFHVYADATGLLFSRYRNAGSTTYVLTTTPFTLKAKANAIHELQADISADGLNVTLTLDGVSETRAFTAARPTPTADGAIYAVGASPVFTYGASYSDGAYIMNPREHDDTYTTIRNTGSAGGFWQIARVDTGYKLAVVDRPLHHFDGVDDYMFSAGVAGVMMRTRMIAFRKFGSQVGTYGGLLVMDGGTGSNAGGNLHLDTGGKFAFKVATSNGTSDTLIASDLPTEGQHVLAAVVEPNKITLYDNGAKYEKAAPAGVTFKDPVAFGGNAGIMAYPAGTYPMNGEFMAAASWNRALSEQEIAAASAELVKAVPVTTAERSTGWMNWTALLINGWTVTSGYAYLLRIGSMVHVKLYGLTPPATWNGVFLNNYQGFAPASTWSGIPIVNTVTPIAGNTLTISATNYTVGGPALATSVVFRVHFSYPCTDDWPMVLPGVGV